MLGKTKTKKMFYLLLLVTFALSAIVAAITTRIFTKPASAILKRIIQDEIYVSWLTYLKFALYVVGISYGVRIDQIEDYTIPSNNYGNKGQILQLTLERWTLEVYRTIIESLQGLAWVLLVFFGVSLLIFMFVKIAEIIKRPKTVTEA
jgi:hypothetical protein